MMEKNAQEWDARWWKVIDNDTGKMIDNVVWANDETEEYHVVPPISYELGRTDIPVYEYRGNISLVNTLWDKTLSISGSGNYDAPFEVWIVEDGMDVEFVAGFVEQEDATEYIRKVAAREL